MSAVVFLSLFFLSSVLAALPDGWTACKQSAPDFNSCIQKAIYDAAMYLMPGNKEMGTMPLDPLFIERMVIPSHPGSVSLDITFTNISITGLGANGNEITKTEFDWETADILVHFPYLNAESDYKMAGKVLTLPIQGEGKCNMTLEEVDVDVKLHMGTTEKDGETYVIMDHFLVDIKPKHIVVYYDNLFNGDKALGDTMNTFLNVNWKEIFAEFQPALQKGLSVAFSSIANRVLSKIPADQIKLP